MSRRALALALPLLLLIPAAAANEPPAPTLTGTDYPGFTYLSWSSPAGYNAQAWTLHRTSTSGDLDATFDLSSSQTTFQDIAPPPGETFSWTVTYQHNGNTSASSNAHVRQTPPFCDLYDPWPNLDCVEEEVERLLNGDPAP